MMIVMGSPASTVSSRPEEYHYRLHVYHSFACAGATMVLFCAEAVEWVTSGMFGKPWKKAEYLRTDCFRAAAASCAVPSAPSRVNAKAVLLGGVPWEEQWWAPPLGPAGWAHRV